MVHLAKNSVHNVIDKMTEEVLWKHYEKRV